MEFDKSFTNVQSNSKSTIEDIFEDIMSNNVQEKNISIQLENKEGDTSITTMEVDYVDGFVYKTLLTIEPTYLDLLMKKKVKLGDECFICAHCRINFNSKSIFTQHMKTHNAKKEVYRCTECYLIYSTLSAVQNHIEVDHKRETPQQCENKSMQTEDINKAQEAVEETNSLEEDEVAVIEDATMETNPTNHSPEIFDPLNYLFKCEQCRKPFGPPDFNREESRPFKKNRKQVFKYNWCKFKMMKDFIIQYHLKTHPPLRCDFCNGAFTTKYKVNKHSNRRIGRKPKICFKNNLCRYKK